MSNKIPKYLANSTYGKELQEIADDIGDVQWDEYGAYVTRNGVRVDVNHSFLYPHLMVCKKKPYKIKKVMEK